MKSLDQHNLTIFDVLPPQSMTSEQLSQNTQTLSGKKIDVTVKATQPLTIPAKTKRKKLNSKEARLVFYSTLATHGSTPNRISRRIMPLPNESTEIDTKTSEEELDDLLKEIKNNLESTPTPLAATRSSPQSLQVSSFGALRIKAIRFKKMILDWIMLNLKKVNRRITILTSAAVLTGLLIATLVQANRADTNPPPAANPTQAPAATDTEWQQSKLEWDCTYARYQAKQTNKPLDSEKEKLCANIN